jgi:hypothetical protein
MWAIKPLVRGTVANHSEPIKNENNTTDIGVIGKIINNSPINVLRAYTIANKYFLGNF